MKKRKMKLFVISILLVLVLSSLLNFVSGNSAYSCPDLSTQGFNLVLDEDFSQENWNILNPKTTNKIENEIAYTSFTTELDSSLSTIWYLNNFFELNTNYDFKLISFQKPKKIVINKPDFVYGIGLGLHNGDDFFSSEFKDYGGSNVLSCPKNTPNNNEVGFALSWGKLSGAYYSTDREKLNKAIYPQCGIILNTVYKSVLSYESSTKKLKSEWYGDSGNLINNVEKTFSSVPTNYNGLFISGPTILESQTAKVTDETTESEFYRICVYSKDPGYETEEPNIPEVKEAYWTNMDDEKITKASLGDTVFMNAMAATGSSITMQQLMKYLLSWRVIGIPFVPSSETQISMIESLYSKDTQFFEKGTYKFRAYLPEAQSSPNPSKESGELEIVEGENSLPVAKIIKIMQDDHVLENSGEGLRESNTQNSDLFFATGIPIEFFQNSSDANDKLTLNWSMGTGIGSYNSGNVGIGSTYGDSEPEKIFIISDYSIHEKNSKDLEDGRYLGDVLHTYNNPGGYNLKLSVTEQFDETLTDRSPITNEVSVLINLVRVGINVIPKITFPKNYFTVSSDKGTKIKFNANKTYVLDCRLKNQVVGEEGQWCEDPFGIELETYPAKCCRYVHHPKLGINMFTNTKLDRGYELNLTWIIIPEKTYNEGFLKTSYYWNGDLESACNLVSLNPLLENCIVISGSWYENYTDVVEFEKTFPSPTDNEQLKYRVFLRAIYRDCIGEEGCWDGN